jgi:predicted enzyme related to lactoylglutathione lyase
MTPPLRTVCALAVPLLALWLPVARGHQAAPTQEKAARVQYLEFVTPDVDATCAALAKLHGVRFGEPVAALGQARTAPLAGGGRIGVRAPLRADEQPVVRPYVLVEDLAAALEAAVAAGAELALGATELPGQGKCAIYLLGGIQHGLWQL